MEEGAGGGGFYKQKLFTYYMYMYFVFKLPKPQVKTKLYHLSIFWIFAYPWIHGIQTYWCANDTFNVLLMF